MVRKMGLPCLRLAFAVLTTGVAWLPSEGAAEAVSMENEGLTLVGNLERAADWPQGPTLLITHGTLSHKDSEIIQTLQTLFLEAGTSSLAINLSLGIDRRQGSFDCSLEHTHRHGDATAELDAWLRWLERAGATHVVPLGHSRGANQTAWFTAHSNSPLIVAQVLVAPPAASVTRNLPQLTEARQLADRDEGKTTLRLERFLYCENATVTAATLLSYYDTPDSLDTRIALRQTTTPTLIFVGSDDDTTPGLEEAYADLAMSSPVEMVVIDGADHFFRDLFADELVEATLEFLERVRPPTD